MARRSRSAATADRLARRSKWRRVSISSHTVAGTSTSSQGCCSTGHSNASTVVVNASLSARTLVRSGMDPVGDKEEVKVYR
jgi:hypothetical protein